jgi:hypothetical protein
VYALLAADPTFSRVRRLMEVDWSLAEVTVEELGLPRLMRIQAGKLWALLDGGAMPLDAGAVAAAIRYTERHDALARDALWWLGQISFDPLLRAAHRGV